MPHPATFLGPLGASAGFRAGWQDGRNLPPTTTLLWSREERLQLASVNAMLLNPTLDPNIRQQYLDFRTDTEDYLDGLAAGRKEREEANSAQP